MRLVIFIFLFAISEHLFSQRFDCDSIFKYTLADIAGAVYNNSSNHQYSKDDIKCFATKLSEFDKLIGKKRIFVLSDMFDTPCARCYYSRAGFETCDFGAADVANDDAQLFIQSYNSNMEKMIPVDQLTHIHQSLKKENPVFISILPANSKFEIERLSDTLLNLRMHNDTLEYLFNDNMKYLKIYVGDSTNGISWKEYGYSEIRSSGARIGIGKENVKKIHITYDFNDMPDKFEVCWCNLLEKKYQLTLPVRIK